MPPPPRGRLPSNRGNETLLDALERLATLRTEMDETVARVDVLEEAQRSTGLHELEGARTRLRDLQDRERKRGEDERAELKRRRYELARSIGLALLGSILTLLGLAAKTALGW